MTDETRIVDPVTGGEKGQKLAQLGALDASALLELAKVAGYGGQKYARGNFLKGYAHSLSFDALQRHLLLYQSGQDIDDESQLPHLAHAAWHCLALLAFQIHGLGTDDRFKSPQEPKPTVVTSYVLVTAPSLDELMLRDASPEWPMFYGLLNPHTASEYGPTWFNKYVLAMPSELQIGYDGTHLFEVERKDAAPPAPVPTAVPKGELHEMCGNTSTGENCIGCAMELSNVTPDCPVTWSGSGHWFDAPHTEAQIGFDGTYFFDPNDTTEITY